MKKICLFILSFILTINTLNAQTDPKAQGILKGVSTKYKSYKSLVASFKLNILDQKAKQSSNQNGTITLKGSQFNLTMNDQVVMCDGKTNWTFIKESNEVQISENKPSPDALTPASIFTLYEKGFKSKLLSDKGSSQLIELIPEDAKKSYIKIHITIDKAGKYVKEAKIFDKGGSIYTYSIVKFTPNANVSADLFSFNKAKYPGVDVVDLR